MVANGKSFDNLKKRNQFTKSPQGLDEKKSQGQIERSRRRNLLMTARTLFENADILPELVEGVRQEVEEGRFKNAIDLFKVIKENEAQDINLSGGVEVQKVFVDATTKKQAKQHIKDFIGDD